MSNKMIAMKQGKFIELQEDGSTKEVSNKTAIASTAGYARVLWRTLVELGVPPIPGMVAMDPVDMEFSFMANKSKRGIVSPIPNMVTPGTQWLVSITGYLPLPVDAKHPTIRNNLIGCKFVVQAPVAVPDRLQLLTALTNVQQYLLGQLGIMNVSILFHGIKAYESADEGSVDIVLAIGGSAQEDKEYRDHARFDAKSVVLTIVDENAKTTMEKEGVKSDEEVTTASVLFC